MCCIQHRDGQKYISTPAQIDPKYTCNSVSYLLVIDWKFTLTCENASVTRAISMLRRITTATTNH